MRIAAYQWNGQRHVGIVSEDGQSLIPMDAVIALGCDLKQLPLRSTESLPWRDVKLEAPIPLPRRNFFA